MNPPEDIPASGPKWLNRAYLASLALVVVLGIGFRSAGYFDGSISLWWDEVDWLIKLLDRPITELRFRPIGYMWLSRLMVGIQIDETFVRLTSFVPSLLSIALVYSISTRIFKSRVSILFALFIFCLNTPLIAFAKEFKPYSMEVFVHLGLVWLTLRYSEVESKARLSWVLGCCAVGMTLAYNIVFLFPSIMLTLMWLSYRNGDRRTLSILVSVSAAALVFLILLAKLTVLSQLDLARQESYWGTKYDVFFMGSGIFDRITWLFGKYADLVHASLRAKVFWSFGFDLKVVLAPVAYAAHLAGLITLVARRDIARALLFVLPIAVAIFFNGLGMWPFGAFRTSLFLYEYFAFISLLGLDAALTASSRTMRVGAAVVVAAIVSLQLPLDLSYHNVKPLGSLTYHSEMRAVLEHIYQVDREELGGSPSGIIVVDNHSFAQIAFYVHRYPATAPRFEGFFSNYNIMSKKLSGVAGSYSNLDQNLRTIRPGRRLWIIVAKPPHLDKVAAMPIIKKHARFVKNFGGGNLLVLWIAP